MKLHLLVKILLISIASVGLVNGKDRTATTVIDTSSPELSSVDSNEEDELAELVASTPPTSDSSSARLSALSLPLSASSTSLDSACSDIALTPIAKCEPLEKVRHRFIQNMLAYGHNHPLAALIKLLFPITTGDYRELFYFFWNFNDECINFLRENAIPGPSSLDTETSVVSECFTKVEKNVLNTLISDAAKRGKKHPRSGFEFSRSKRLLLSILTALYQCMLLDAVTTTSPIENNFANLQNGSCEKLALLLLNFYRYSISGNSQFSAPVGTNYADRIAPCIPDIVMETGETESAIILAELQALHTYDIGIENTVCSIYTTLIIATGFYTAIHFNFRDLSKTPSLPRHIVTKIHTLPETADGITLSSSTDSLDSLASTATGSSLSRTRSLRSLTPPIPHIAEIQALCTKFDQYINALLTIFYEELNRYKTDDSSIAIDSTMSFCILQHTFYEILQLKTQQLLCFPGTELCPFELGSLIVAAKRIKKAFTEYSIYQQKKCPPAIRKIACSTEFDQICLIRHKHIMRVGFEHLLAKDDKGLLKLDGGHVPFEVPYTTHCAVDVREPVHALVRRLGVVTPLQQAYTSPRSGCSTRILSVATQPEQTIKVKTQFPSCFLLHKNLPIYLQTLIRAIKDTQVVPNPTLAVLENNTSHAIHKYMYGQDLNCRRVVSIIEHDHSTFCTLAGECPFNHKSQIKVIVPQLIVNLPDNAGSITVILSAYPMGADCYSSRADSPHKLKIARVACDTISQQCIFDADGLPAIISDEINIKQAYATFQSNVVNSILKKPLPLEINDLIERNTIINKTLGQISTWSYLDPEKTVIGQVIMFNHNDRLILENILSLLSTCPTKQAIRAIYKFLNQTVAGNSSAFLKALRHDFLETLQGTDEDLGDESINDILIRFFTRHHEGLSLKIAGIPYQQSLHDMSSGMAGSGCVGPVDAYSTAQGRA